MGERAGRAAGPDAGKVTAGHRGRDAIIYVRQSTFTQTQENTESLALQYELRRTRPRWAGASTDQRHR